MTPRVVVALPWWLALPYALIWTCVLVAVGAFALCYVLAAAAVRLAGIVWAWATRPPGYTPLR